MIIGYPPEQAGQISVTATKEEWREVMRNLDYMDDYEMLTDESRELRAHLYQQGIR